MEYKVTVEFNEEKLTGILINETDKFLCIKLSSGYNANLKKDNCKILEKEEYELSNNSLKKEEKKEGSAKPKILLLHTGGTIASKVDYRTGAVSSKYTAEELLDLFPELCEKCDVEATVISNIFSEDMRFNEYNDILEELKNIPQEISGVIISHGTDTMHYSAAALHYAIQGLNIPVILVGAQRSSDRASSDAFSNLNSAVNFIIENKKLDNQFRRVGICMHETINDDNFIILDAINAKKMHSTRRDAFKQINYLPAARINLKGELEIIRNELFSKESKEKLKITKYDENLKIGFFKAHPHMFEFEVDMLKNYDAVIVEGTGIGNVPEHVDNKKEDKKILSKFKNISKNVKLIPAVQTVYGEVSLDIYSRGRDMQNSGFVGNRLNLCSETLFIRVAHILSLEDGKDNFEKYWAFNLEGFEVRNEDN